MKQVDLGLQLSVRRTLKQMLLDEMEQVMLWGELLALIASHAPMVKTILPSVDLVMMLHIHSLQQRFGLSDMGVDEASFETAFYRHFVGASCTERIANRVSILCFRRLLEECDLRPKIMQVINVKLLPQGLLLKPPCTVDATLTEVFSPTKNKTREHNPEMHQVKKVNQWYIRIKALIGFDAEFGLVRIAIATVANVNSVTEGLGLLYGEKALTFADAGCRVVAKRPGSQALSGTWSCARANALLRGTSLGTSSPSTSRNSRPVFVPNWSLHSGRQTVARSQQGSLLVSCQHHRSTRHAACPVQYLGRHHNPLPRCPCMSASENIQRFVVRRENRSTCSEKAAVFLGVSSGEKYLLRTTFQAEFQRETHCLDTFPHLIVGCFKY